MNAIDLINKALDFICFHEKQICNWQVEKVKDKPPSLLRLQQIEALLQAFQITNWLGLTSRGILNEKGDYEYNFDTGEHLMSNLEYFIAGKFILEKESAHNAELVKAMKDLALSEYSKIYKRGKKMYLVFSNGFQELFEYRRKIHCYTRTTWIQLEGVDVVKNYLEKVQKEFMKQLKKDLKIIDNILCLMIDPEQCEFSIEELKEKYSYPDVDLEEVDRDWFFDNF